ncbi:CpsD/CapB family tyrosine-protein kinase [Bacillus sp. NPDC094106]|uniref:CpsD/CapB family tyrosine-protein kinase n=1 Tax=Bacillus sp. NPDC094106 TaxID=3363949 RepID=UPI003818292A
MFVKKATAIRKLISHVQPQSQVAEQYRNIRTNIQFTAIESEMHSIVVTSSNAGEGKTTTTANLAVVFGQQGKKVLLIGADMRKPALEQLFQTKSVLGVTNVLSGQASFKQCVQETYIPNVSFIPSGPIPPNPAELLSCGKMKELIEQGYAEYDLILIDTPPVLAVTDAQIVANLCDGIILVVRSEVTEKDKVVKAKQLLDKTTGKLLGVVLNDKKQVDTKYGYY